MPAINSKAIAKARVLSCDALILDLEDSVAPDVKNDARENAVSAVASGGFGNRELIVRVNGLDTEWGLEDMKAFQDVHPDAILAPKVSSLVDVERYAEHLPEQAKLWVMIETARSAFRLEEIAGGALGKLSALVVGTNDLAQETNTELGPDRTALLGIFWLMVAAARMNELSIIDGVFNDLDDDKGFLRQAQEAAALGFDGKSLVHPRQIELCHQAFAPSADAVVEAKLILAAFADPSNSEKGVIRLGGRMVERLHLEGAIRTLAAAGEYPPHL